MLLVSRNIKVRASARLMQVHDLFEKAGHKLPEARLERLETEAVETDAVETEAVETDARLETEARLERLEREAVETV